MKDEAGMVIKEFIGLRSKMYSYESITKPQKYKGVSKQTIKKDITKMITVILSLVLQKKTHSMKSIKSHNHIIKSCEISKCSLSCFDNIRYILEDGITTLAYGYLVGRETTCHKKRDHR